MFRFIMAALLTLGIASTANAGHFTIQTYDDGSSYLEFKGEITGSDPFSFARILNEVKSKTNENGEPVTFSGDIWMASVGGSMTASIRLAEMISENGLSTIVNDNEVGCYSGCALMWLAGGKDARWLGDNGIIGFHHPYTTETRTLQEIKEVEGWLGIQNHISHVTMHFAAQLLRYGVNDPGLFIHSIAPAKVNDFVTLETNNETGRKIVGYRIL